MKIYDRFSFIFTDLFEKKFNWEVFFRKQIIVAASQHQFIIQSNNLGKNACFNSWIRTWFTCLMPCVRELAETHLNAVSKEETKQTALLI